MHYDAVASLFTKTLPVEFDSDTYHIRPMNKNRIIPVQNGHIFELDNRQLKVIHTPGHAQDCIMLLDRKNRSLFTGDAYCEWMYAFLTLGCQNPSNGSPN